MKETQNDTADSCKKTVDKRTVKKKKVTKLFRDSENTMAMDAVDKLKRHSGSAVNGVHVSASRTEAAVTTKRNEFPFFTVWTAIHGTTKGSVTTVDHFFDIFYDRFTWM